MVFGRRRKWKGGKRRDHAESGKKRSGRRRIKTPSSKGREVGGPRFHFLQKDLKSNKKDEGKNEKGTAPGG